MRFLVGEEPEKVLQTSFPEVLQRAIKSQGCHKQKRRQGQALDKDESLYRRSWRSTLQGTTSLYIRKVVV
jgi:hypothetical protein